MKVVPPFGKKPAKIYLVGEAPGEEEEKLGIPFIGKSGQELSRMLQEAEINLGSCRRGNVIPIRPKNNNFDEFLTSKKNLPKEYSHPPLSQGKYLRPEYFHYLDLLFQDIKETQPNLIIALGNTALWALTGERGISTARGVITSSPHGKVLPVFHPAAILRQWALRVVTVGDFQKAKREAEFPEIRRPERDLLIAPTFEEVLDFEKEYLIPARRISFDIETKLRTITCIALSPSPSIACCIPFWNREKKDQCYWPEDQEIFMWKLIKKHLERRDVIHVAQNGLYDIQYLSTMSIYVPNLEEDTMLKHHAMYPEMKKGLGFLGSAYTDELSWKEMAKTKAKDK